MCLAPGVGWGGEKQNCSPAFIIASSTSCIPTVCWAGERLVTLGRDPESPGCETWQDTPTVRAPGVGGREMPSLNLSVLIKEMD